jgi:hypothetical protein
MPLIGVVVILTILGAMCPPTHAIPAFPGAEGYGTETPGGRGGRVIEVTNVNDSGPGSLRQACEVETGPRIVVFRVSGTIELSANITIREANSYVTVAGQTAPGDGIQLKNWTIAVAYGGHDAIIRHIRARPGSGALTADNGGQIDGILVYGGGGKHTYNVVIDHCSVMWAADENGEAYSEVSDVTYQWCIFAEGLQGGHPKGPHSMGMLIGGWGNSRTLTASVHHCLFAHNGGRNPALIFNNPLSKPVSRFDFRNNVVYNWNNNYAQFTTHGEFEEAHGPEVNFVDNIYLKGPDGNPRDDNVVWVKGAARLYIEGNTTPACPDGTGDGWAVGVRETDDKPDYGPADEARYQAKGPFDTPPITATLMDELLDLVLRNAGATRPRRDAVDQRIADEVTAGTGEVGKGSDHPELRSSEPPTDSDHDGMPDAWEQDHGLNPNDPDDRNGDLDGDGYTNVEQYLNELASQEG